MSLEKLISKNIDRQTAKSRTARRVALIGTAICFAVMVVAMCTEKGFNQAIESRMSLLLADFRLTEEQSWFSEQGSPMVLDEEFLQEITAHKAVSSAYPTLDLASVIQSGPNNEGVIIKGVDPTYFGSTIDPLITHGSSLALSQDNTIIVSTTLARTMGLELGDRASIVIFSDNYSNKANVVVGAIFDTSVGDVEKSLVISSLQFAQKLTQADSSTISAYEIHGSIGRDALEDIASQYALQTTSLEQRASELFDWLSVLRGNMLLVLTIMLIVAMINIASSSLITILENTQKIALLSALGMNQRGLQRIFLRHTMSLVARGAIYGVSIALVLVAAQNTLQIIRLDPVSYFVDVLPMEISALDIIVVLSIAFAFVFLVVWIATRLVSRTEVSSGLKFE